MHNHSNNQQIYYKQIPLKKIASKSRYKNTLKQYANRGRDKNGRLKAKQAHMELVIHEREKIAEELFQKHKENLVLPKPEGELTTEDKMKLIALYMPPEPELDSTLFYYNTGYRKSHGDSSEVRDKDTGEMRFASQLISKEDMLENPDLKGDYNVDKYIAAFNEKVKAMLHAFDPEIAEMIPVKIVRKRVKDQITGKKVEQEELIINQFTKDQLTLKSFDLDDIDESMHLEKFEVEFWNESGFDPRLVWNGFKMHEDDKVHYEIYENALKYLNEKMKEKNYPMIKSRNETLSKGDFVLIKNGSVYRVGKHNGTYIEIVRRDVKVPKSEIELELDRKSEEEARKKRENVENLESPELKSEKVLTLEDKAEKRIEFFDAFKERFGIPAEINYGKFMGDAGDEGAAMIDQFIDAEEKRKINEANEYIVDPDAQT